MLESELFGHAKGAFTGAERDRKGAFEEAHAGTLFLDEIGECDGEMQAKLLRVLQPPPDDDPCRRSFYRVGESTERQSNVRVIGATNRDLLAAVNEGRFREDLYYRLAVISINIPPLRERQGDIPRIAAHLISRPSKRCVSWFRELYQSLHDTCTCMSSISSGCASYSSSPSASPDMIRALRMSRSSKASPLSPMCESVILNSSF